VVALAPALLTRVDTADPDGDDDGVFEADVD
jgi:hypothetical protein